MKKFYFLSMLLMVSMLTIAQGKISFRSDNRAECVKSDATSLKAFFSFSELEAEDFQNERGTFSFLTLPNTYMGGKEGDPQIPVVNELFAVPFGATPSIRVSHCTATDYRLEDYGMHRLSPRQPSVRKDQRPDEVTFVMNESAYQRSGLRNEPMVSVSLEGVMRGIQVGSFTIEPVSYDPVNNTIRVFNDIEVEVSFEGADMAATEDMLVRTYSPYFDIVYKQMFNNRAILDLYTDHPDLYTTPVRMLVITTPTYADNTAFQNWVNWKKQKGIYVEVCTTSQTGTTASSIRSFIQNKYNAGVQNSQPLTFVVIVGDKADVTCSSNSNTTGKVTDLYYGTLDSDLYPEVYVSRMPVASATDLSNLVAKMLQYEQYTMPDPSYLSKVLLIAGADSYWNSYVGQPTINYAANNYFNTAHGFTNIYKYLSSYSGCYNNLSTGVGFANYTAHGDNTMWYSPQFTTSNVNSLTNTDKYFWAMGNCCLAANWGYNGTCLAEAMLRAANKGAFSYIGSCPETYWYEDYYYGVGATNVFGSTPAMTSTQTGVYDVMFQDDSYNTLNSVTFLGNIAVCYAHGNGYTGSVSNTYYWEAYHTLGDGSIMPYTVQPTANVVSHAGTITVGATSFTVNAQAGSYVALTMNNEILGAAQVGTTGVVNVPISGLTNQGQVMVVVTRQQRQPYTATIQAVGGSVTNFTISTSANPVAGGTVTGGGTFAQGSSCTLTATANAGYVFVNWTKNGMVVSTEANYTFNVTENATYVANFEEEAISLNVTAAYYPDASNPQSPYVQVTWNGRRSILVDQAQYVTDPGAINGADASNLQGAQSIFGPGVQHSNGNTVGDDFTLTADAVITSIEVYGYQTGSTTTSTFNALYAAIYDGHPANGGQIIWGSLDNNIMTSTAWTNCYRTSNLSGTTRPVMSITAENLNIPLTAGTYYLVWNLGGTGSSGPWGQPVAIAGQTVTGDAIQYTSSNGWQNLTDSGSGDPYGMAFRLEGTSSGVSEAQYRVYRTACSNNGPYTTANTVMLADNLTGSPYIDETWNNVAAGSYKFGVSVLQDGNESEIDWSNCLDKLAVETYTITASADPIEGGTVSGAGTFTSGASCTLVATPNSGYNFVNWTKDGTVVSTNASYTFDVTENAAYVAHFEEVVINLTVTAAYYPDASNPQSPYVLVNWAQRSMWDYVTSFEGSSAGQQAIATDGNYIYTASWQTTPSGGHTFYQYDMQGNFIEGFDISGATGIRDLTTDGDYFYGTSGGSEIFILDFTNRILVGTINCPGLTSRHISYDPERDGFWSGNWSTLNLYSRTGAVLQSGPAPVNAYGSAYYKDEYNEEHLFLFCQPNSDAKVYDYDINTNTISATPIFDFSVTPGFNAAIAGGCFIGVYGDKLCWFGNAQQDPNLIGIYELRDAVPTEYRVYRTDCDNNGPYTTANTVLLADHLVSDFYVDLTWNDMIAGNYKFGVSIIRDGNESDIFWSNCLEKPDVTGVEEGMTTLSLYPNPANDKLVLESSQPIERCEIYSVTGALLKRFEGEATRMELQVGTLPAGMYLVRLTTGDQVLTRRFVKE